MSQQDVFIYTMNQGGTRGKWSRYQFPFIIQHFAHLGDKLYLREGDTVHEVQEHNLYDNGIPFESVVQWPWLDFGQPARTKMMVGFDLVGEGTANVEIGYDQRNVSAYTASFEVPGDSYPGNIIPIPVTAPTFSMKLTYESDTNWEWHGANLYVQDHEIGK